LTGVKKGGNANEYLRLKGEKRRLFRELTERPLHYLQ